MNEFEYYLSEEKMIKAGAKGMTVYRISKWDKYAPVAEEISHFLLGE